ncbi:hypothetical protein SAY86_013565 [Trapa natans]|uniref:Uncharacterized protein n=1 Tax=Trapa natans TaxID=22666 RepID=A0AAN7KXJ6_TRANT|nr:hypothetical protein SAY86_013565 [Trapa natans]
MALIYGNASTGLEISKACLNVFYDFRPPHTRVAIRQITNISPFPAEASLPLPLKL